MAVYNQKDYSISLLRVLSMTMIIVCHVFTHLGLHAIAQMLNVGIYTFLLISGFLYSGRTITDSKKWLVIRWKKLCVPVLIWMVFVGCFSASALKIYPDTIDILLFLANLQGFSSIVSAFPSLKNPGAFVGLGSLWFVTVIFICYLLLILVKSLEKKFGKNPHIYLTWLVLLILFLGLSYFEIYIGYILCFFLGYTLYKSKYSKSITNKEYCVITTLMLISIVARLAGRLYLDNTYIYGTVIVTVTHTILAVWIFFTIRRLVSVSAFFERIASGAVIQKIDSMSYYLYITHNYFLAKQVGLSMLFPPLAVRLLVFAALTIVSAIILQLIHILMVPSVRTNKTEDVRPT